ncbi:M23 family metallopeptidase [Chitinophaga sp.]|uniref:M23 family metallopeptidase n=1 Tax=Chitinophaga sp. TaxID=1869181 RepID=UPI0031D06C14
MAVLLAGCSTSKRGIFAKKTPHEQYAARILDAGLKETALGSLWFAAAEKALLKPLTVSLPYQETGYFAADRPDAAGYIFTAQQGEQLHITVSVKPAGNIRLFADLWQPAAAGGAPSLLASADTTHLLQYEAERNSSFVLRLQPELLSGVEYTISITTRPSLAFPVPGQANGRIGSFWGDARDRGARSHEGVDIFGKFRMPVVAAADGFVTRTGENNLGGKVVFLRPDNKNYTLYYAHLDSQLVTSGQRVAAGDTVGLMGNTGNARNTPTHLHFGIYTGSGAVDPLPFIKADRQNAPAITASLNLLSAYCRNSAQASLYDAPSNSARVSNKLPANQVMRILAAAGGWYKVSLPDNREGFIESSRVTTRPYRKLVTAAATPLLDAPDSTAAVKSSIAAGETLQLLGGHNGYYFTENMSVAGWVKI